MNDIYKPKHIYLPTKYFLLEHVESTYVTQLLKDLKWQQTMFNEFNELIQYGTWSLVPVHETYNIVGHKWIFHLKRWPNRSITCYKARL